MSTATANGTKPFDLDAAADAAVTDAEAAPFAFTFKGESYTVPPSTDWPISALRKISAGDLDGAMPVLLGEDAYERLSAAGLKVGDLSVLFEAIAQHSGMTDLPNSPPPQRRASTRT